MNEPKVFFTGLNMCDKINSFLMTTPWVGSILLPLSKKKMNWHF